MSVTDSLQKVTYYTNEHRITQCARELNAMIVSYSAAKLHKRIEKRWSAFQLLMGDLLKSIRPEKRALLLRGILQTTSFMRDMWYFEPRIWGNYEYGS